MELSSACATHIEEKKKESKKGPVPNVNGHRRGEQKLSRVRCAAGEKERVQKTREGTFLSSSQFDRRRLWLPFYDGHVFRNGGRHRRVKGQPVQFARKRRNYCAAEEKCNRGNIGIDRPVKRGR